MTGRIAILLKSASPSQELKWGTQPMTAEDSERLSRISTHWSLVFQAHQEAGVTKTAAQAALLHRYRGAIYRYLRSVVPDAHAVEDLCQEFAHRFVRGDFHRANPALGRFRNFVKTAVAHLIADWRRRRQAGLQPVPLDKFGLEALPGSETDPGQKFEELWRAELRWRPGSVATHWADGGTSCRPPSMTVRADAARKPGAPAMGGGVPSLALRAFVAAVPMARVRAWFNRALF